MAQLEQLYNDLGNPGAYALYIAARRAGIEVKKADVRTFVSKQSSTQTLAAQQPSKGKIASESLNARWQMDLIDARRFKAAYWLICVNVFDRKIYVEQCDSKRPVDVLQALELIISRVPKPNIIFADDEGSFNSGMLKGFLQANNISISYTDSNDRNALAIADRAIGMIKQKAAELQTATSFLLTDPCGQNPTLADNFAFGSQSPGLGPGLGPRPPMIEFAR